MYVSPCLFPALKLFNLNSLGCSSKVHVDFLFVKLSDRSALRLRTRTAETRSFSTRAKSPNGSSGCFSAPIAADSMSSWHNNGPRCLCADIKDGVYICWNHWIIGLGYIFLLLNTFVVRKLSAGCSSHTELALRLPPPPPRDKTESFYLLWAQKIRRNVCSESAVF